MPELAILGGSPVRKGGFPEWPPVFEQGCKGQTYSTDDLETLFSVYQQAEYARFFSSHQAAVNSLLQALHIGKGDEIILPAYGATLLAKLLGLSGIRIVFADVSAENYQIDPASVEQKISSETRAVVAGHLGGVTSDLDSLGQICKRSGAFLLEDISEAVGAEWSGLRAGSCGTAAIGLFSPESLLSLTDIAVVLSNRDDVTERLASQPALYCNLKQHTAGEIMHRLESFPDLYAKREKSAQRLTERLKDIPGVAVQSRVKKITARAWSSFILRYDIESFDNLPNYRFVEALEAEGIPADMGPSLNTALSEAEAMEQFPQAARAAFTEAVWLPSRILLADQMALEQVAEAVLKIRKFHMELDR